MKKILAGLLMLVFSSACSTTYKPVASLNDIAPKAEIDKSRNWIEPGSDAKQAAAFTSGLLGGLLIGLPLAMALASIPDERDMTMSELAEKVAAKTCDRTRKTTYYASGLSEDLSIMGVNIPDEETLGLRPVGIMYIAKESDNKLFYPEVRMVKKIDENTYWNWRIPLFKKTSEGNLVFILNEKLRLDGPVTMKGGSDDLFEFTFIDDLAGGIKVTKGENALFNEIKNYFMGNSFEMDTMRCALGDKICGKKDAPAGKEAKVEPAAAVIMN